MNNISKLFYLFFFFALSVSLTAQEDQLSPCGTDMGISPWLRDFQSRIQSAPRTEDMLYLPMQVHVVGNDEGSGHMSLNGVLRAFCTLNEDFLSSNIQFFMDADINYINDTEYFDHDYGSGFQMMHQYNSPNAINCYIVESPAGNCGYFAPGADGIALAKNCTKPNDHTWAHEVGHFLSLPHPFYGWEGNTHDYSLPAPEELDGYEVEKLDGSNCEYAADGFCDTAPDYLNYRWSCNNDGVSNTVQHDPNGEPFVSDGELFMSYSNAFCKAYFSDDQIAAMRANVEEQRPNLLTAPPVVENISITPLDDIEVISPLPGTLAEGESVLLEWEAVPNATHYVVQLNPFNFFSIVFNEYVTESTSIEATGLQSDKTYYWRIFPFNAYNSCANFSGTSSFETGSIVKTNTELYADEYLRLFPNPVSNGQVHVDLRLNEREMAQWQLLDARGSILQKESFQITSDSQQLAISTEQLPAGIYLLRINMSGRQLVRKIVKS